MIPKSFAVLVQRSPFYGRTVAIGPFSHAQAEEYIRRSGTPREVSIIPFLEPVDEPADDIDLAEEV